MIHCTTYVNDQGQPLAYFLEFKNVTEEKDGKVKPVKYADHFMSQECMHSKAQSMAERYTQGIVYKTVIEPDYL
jgi:hypothetical protein